MAILIISLFALGLYMVELDYYSKWYTVAPWWHKSIRLAVYGIMKNLGPESKELDLIFSREGVRKK